MGQHDPAVVVAHDDADVARAAAVDVAMEHDGVAGLVAPDVGSLHPGEPPVDQAVDGERAAPQHAFLREPLAHGLVRLPADRVRGGEDQGVRPVFRRQREPATPRLQPKLLRRRLPHPIAQRRDRRARLPFPGKTHRSPQLRVALALHLLHRRCRHARLLQQTEGLARIHRLQTVWCRPPARPAPPSAARATRSSASMRTLPVIEASSTARTAPPYSARARASRSGSERSPKRVRKYCSVRVGDAGLPGENPGGHGRRRQALYLPLPE